MKSCLQIFRLDNMLHFCVINAVFMSYLNLADQSNNHIATSFQMKIIVKLASTAIERSLRRCHSFHELVPMCLLCY